MTFYLKAVDSINPQSNLIHSTHTDLVNNFVHFHKNIKQEELKTWENKPPLYENYPSILDVKDNFINDPYKYYNSGPITVRCPAKYFYTCDSELSELKSDLTYDRLFKFDEIKARATDFMIRQKGFSAKSDILHAMVRWIYNKEGKVEGFALCKDRGNLRTHIGLSSNAGEDVELCITLDFHEPDNTISADTLRQIEAETFMEDAVDRRNFDASVKFRTGYISGRSQNVAQVEFLDKVLDVDFAKVVSKIRLKKEEKAPKFSLSSVQGFDFGKDGQAAGYISKYKEINVTAAVKTLKFIIEERGESTELATSSIHTFIKTFFYLCETPQTIGIKDNNSNIIKAITDREYVQKALRYIFAAESMSGSKLKSLNDIKKTGTDKDTSWFAWKSYMGVLLPDIKEFRGRKNNYGKKHPAIIAYIDSIQERHLQAEATKILGSIA